MTQINQRNILKRNAHSAAAKTIPFLILPGLQVLCQSSRQPFPGSTMECEAEEFLLDNSVLCCRIGKQEFGWGLRSRLNRIPFQKHPPGNPGRLGIPGCRGLQYRALPRGDSTETQKGKSDRIAHAHCLWVCSAPCACAVPCGAVPRSARRGRRRSR